MEPNGVGSSTAMTETWRPILQQLTTELERQSVRMRELEAQRLVDLSVSWSIFLDEKRNDGQKNYCTVCNVCNVYIYIHILVFSNILHMHYIYV